MGLFGGSSSASSSSTNNSYTWDSQEIQDLVNSMGFNINYSNETLDPMNEYMQNFLNYELNPARFNTAKNLGAKASAIWSSAKGDLNNLKGITGADVLGKYEQGTSALFNYASGFMDQQDKAIEDSVTSQLGSDLAQNAMGNNGAAYTSATVNGQTALVAQAGNNMETQESEVASRILQAASKATGGAIKGAFRGEGSLLRGEFGAAGNMAKAAAKSGNNAASNYWNAALVEQAYTQKASNVARKNSMINNNSSLMNNVAELMALLQTAGTDTTSTTTGSSTVSGGGLL